ncbi:MAG TPA: hypothetical protein VMC43_03300 [Candidatus Paceibacterota bacterium]|nr:hypothetical protein [Candidatus Paceibacterota bacterium]
MLGSLFIGRVAHAASPDTCDFNEAFKKLEAAQNDQSLDYSASVKAQLTIRKDILRQVIACNHDDIVALRAKIGTLQTPTDAAQRLRDQLLAALDETDNYFASQSEKIDTLGLRGTQEMAADLLTWRARITDQTTGQVNDFSTWLTNQDIFTTAHARLTYISQTMERLKLDDNDDLSGLLEDAKRNLATADNDNARAFEAMAAFEPTETVTPLIKDSLETLSKTYQIFFEISDAVKKIIPH